MNDGVENPDPATNPHPGTDRTQTGAEPRPSKDEYFMDMAVLASKRSTCLRRKVGAVLVKDDHVLTTGYNGAPKGLDHCEITGCIREQRKVPSGERHELCRGVHAEQNAIIQAAYFGVSVKGAKMYITNHPCSVCAKMMLNAGISEVIYKGDYHDELAVELLGEGEIIIRRL
ncbi:MAG: dCMP deaminase family protein [Thermoplasmata archaeon]|nr:dCMP deaminase family protein [Thermoplasmata archaeon]